MRRTVVRGLTTLLLLAAAAAAAVYLYLRQSLPTVNGRIIVEGLSAPVEILREANAIPHIFGATKRDAFFGLGYAHAQDRLWQMEFQRRIGHGQLSEVFGAATVPQDRFLRTIGFGRAAHSAWNRLPDDARDLVDGYVAGINAFIAAHHGRRLPPEFTLLRFEPKPFTGPDVLVWVKMMAWDLSANYSAELLRHDIVKQIGEDLLAELMPPYPADGPSIVWSTRDAPPAAGHDTSRATRQEARRNTSTSPELTDLVARGLSGGHPAVRQLLMGGGRTEALGSNSWVVDGTLTATGRPLLANDPHLGTHIPSLWYLAHLSAGDFDVIGATLPGIPAVAIGRNRSIAWGETNVAADVEDLFLERIDTDGRTTEFRGRKEPIQTISEEILVKGGAPVPLTVRITRHGPLISDAINANNAALADRRRPAVLEPLAFRWTALDDDDRTLVAFFKINEARNWTEFTEGLRDFVTPSQNFIYADVNGHIGYYAPGRIPVRASGDGSRPVEGWTGDAEWTGWIPFDELPHAFDPPQHLIVTANHKPTPTDDPHLISLEYPNPYRARRILDRLGATRELSVEDFRGIQGDTLSLHALDLLPLLLEHAHAGDVQEHQALELLRRWDGDSRGDSAAAAIFQAWFLRLAPTLAGDELGPRILAAYQGRFSYVTRFVTNVLKSGSSHWCDNVNTPAPETCSQATGTALRDALADLNGRMGRDMTTWRWDRVHRAVFPHQGLDTIRALRPLISRSVPHGGDWSTVNVGPVSADAPYDQMSVPGYRQIVDLSPGGGSRFLDAVGQSGHFLSTHYDDFLPDWQAVRYKAMRMDRTVIDRESPDRLVLTPR